jgi:hypothetical protein
MPVVFFAAKFEHRCISPYDVIFLHRHMYFYVFIFVYIFLFVQLRVYSSRRLSSVRDI